MKKFPLHGWFGVLLVAVFWYLNWTLHGSRTQWCFFFLWLGYILSIDGIVIKRKNSSLLQRSPKKFIVLFLISTPVWWLFEVLNNFTNNWQYLGKEYFSNFQYFMLASLCFSTVMPAVFETAELVSTFKWTKKIIFPGAAELNSSSVQKYFLTGWVFLLFIITLPKYFYYLIWISLFFIIEPINYWFKNINLFNYAKEGNWQPFINLAAGALICGFFWEMWNFFSFPKWIYFLPYLNFAHIFEMPVFGYLGYIPFSFELFAIYNLVTFSKPKKSEDYFLVFH